MTVREANEAMRKALASMPTVREVAADMAASFHAAKAIGRACGDVDRAKRDLLAETQRENIDLQAEALGFPARGKKA